MKLSIIVPVYNVEQYIGACLESIFRQALCDDDYEVVVVNDGTPDRSMDVVSGMQATHHNILVVEQQNQGLSAARNAGLERASGQYVLFLDSDDLLIDGTLHQLLLGGIDADADMVVGDFVKMGDAEIQNMTTLPSTVKTEAPVVTSGKDFFLQEFNPQQCYVWRMLYKRQFLQNNGIRFITGICFEDVPFTTESYLRAGKCVRIRTAFYVYRQRSNSIVTSVNMKKLTDFNTVLAALCDMKPRLCTTPRLRSRMDDTIFVTFSIAVWYLTHDKVLLAERRTFIDDLHKKVPALKFTGGLKQRIVSLMFRYMPETYLWLRSV